MQLMRLWVLVGAILAVVSCGVMPPQNVSSEYLKTEGGGFALFREQREVKYMITLVAKKPLPAGSILDAQFDNPTGGLPLNITHQVGAGQTKLVLTSPPVTGLKAGTRYQVHIKLYSDATRRDLVDSYTQDIQNFVNQAELRW
jgi:hypothetical protein